MLAGSPAQNPECQAGFGSLPGFNQQFNDMQNIELKWQSGSTHITVGLLLP
jgi:hypothetical protein